MGKGRNRKSLIIFHKIEPPSVKDEYQRVRGNDDIAIIYRNVTMFNYAIKCTLAHSLGTIQ